MSDEQKNDQAETSEQDGQTNHAADPAKDHANHKEKVEGCEFC